MEGVFFSPQFCFFFFCVFFLPRHSGTAHWVGFSLLSWWRQREGETRHNNISRFITPASWFMSEKQDTLGCCYFIGTHIWKHTLCLTKTWRHIHLLCVCVCVDYMHLYTCTYTQTVSLIRPGSCCCVRGNYPMKLSEALMESFRLTGSTVRSLDSASFFFNKNSLWLILLSFLS